jgi:hypothetical protein
MAQPAWPVAIGLAAGLGGAIIASRLLQTLLFGVTPTDPATLCIVAGVVAGVTALACAGPMWRAVHMDPIAAIRID